MKVAIFGYPRSGTTMLKDIIMRHLVAAKLNDWNDNLGEPFNPLVYTRLIPSVEDGVLRVKRLSNSPRRTQEGKHTELPGSPQTREERFDLFSRASGDYIVKVLSQDTMHPGILPWLIEHDYHFVTIERRNHFDALLSWLIAWNHNQWSVLEGSERPEYQPFEASMTDVAVICQFMSRFFRYRPTIPNAHRLYYEDMVEMGPEATLRHIGLYQEGVEAPDTVWKKLLGSNEKVRFITNIGEVAEYYRTTVETIASLDP